MESLFCYHHEMIDEFHLQQTGSTSRMQGRQTFKHPVLEIDRKSMAIGCVCTKKQNILG